MRNNKKSNNKPLLMATIVEGAIIAILAFVAFIPQKLETNSETERKWLIRQENIPFSLSDAKVFDIYQTYLSFSPEIRVRKINEERFVLTIKTDYPALKGLKRTEQEYEITKEEYDHLLEKSEGTTIHKTRYSKEINNILYEIDDFHDDLDELMYLEIEFENEKIANEFVQPEWVIVDVTTDLNYKNGYLARYGIPKNFNNLMKGE